MGRGCAWLALFALGCHPRSDALPDLPPRDPPCLGAVVSRLHHRVAEGTLIIEQQLERHCPRPGEPASNVERVAEVTLGQERGCPAGQVALEVKSATVSPTGAAPPGSSPALLEHVGNALRNFAHVHGRGSGLAFVLGCEAPPRWLFVTLDTAHPIVQEFSEAAPPAPVDDQSPGVAEAETVEAPPAPLRTGTCEEKVTAAWVGRQLSTGTMPGPSHLTKWLLRREKGRAELVIQEFETVERGSSEDNPHGAWKCTRSAAYEGTFSGLRFSLGQPPDGPRKSLVCALKPMKVADVEARRVRVSRPAPGEGCNASRWSSAGKTELQVLVCRAAESEDPFFLAAGPGVERVLHDEDVLYDEPKCTGTPAALRRVPVDGGVATAIRASERPR